jgi:rhodanese-related sulfurtransferase
VNQATQTAGFSTIPGITRDALVVVTVACVLALIVNQVRSDGIPLIAKSEFEILVPCPEPMGEAIPIAADAEMIHDPNSLLIDVQSQGGHDAWHLPNALHQPFDWLAEQDEVHRKAAGVAKTIARSRKHRVVVYGDGGNPDSGRHWAALLSAAGIKNVVYVAGGAAAMRQRASSEGGAE